MSWASFSNCASFFSPPLLSSLLGRFLEGGTGWSSTGILTEWCFWSIMSWASIIFCTGIFVRVRERIKSTGRAVEVKKCFRVNQCETLGYFWVTLNDHQDKCDAFVIKTVFLPHLDLTHFHIKSSAPGLGFKVRVFESCKCPLVEKKSCKKKKTKQNALCNRNKLLDNWLNFAHFVAASRDERQVVWLADSHLSCLLPSFLRVLRDL